MCPIWTQCHQQLLKRHYDIENQFIISKEKRGASPDGSERETTPALVGDHVGVLKFEHHHFVNCGGHFCQDLYSSVVLRSDW